MCCLRKVFWGIALIPLALAPTGGAVAQQKDKEPPKEFKNDIGMEFVWIPPGTFMMGSPANEEGRPKVGADVEKQHKVTLTKGFYLGRYEVTQNQWETIMGKNPADYPIGKKLPVTNVNWTECNEFLEKMEKKDGRSYRLPTEAEWEYACRAGTTGRYSCESFDLPDYAWGRENAKGLVHPVGQKKPNPWGLYDMHGNAGEWCSDRFGFYSAAPLVDPSAPPVLSETLTRVIRGGCVAFYAKDLRSAARTADVPDARGSNTHGLRAVMYGPKK